MRGRRVLRSEVGKVEELGEALKLTAAVMLTVGVLPTPTEVLRVSTSMLVVVVEIHRSEVSPTAVPVRLVEAALLIVQGSD